MASGSLRVVNVPLLYEEAMATAGVEVSPTIWPEALMPNAKVPLVAEGSLSGGVGAAAVEEAVGAGVVGVLPDDLARVVDAEC